MKSQISNNPIKASVWYTICSIIQKGINTLLIPIYVRLMSTEQYGTYTLYQSWLGIIIIFSTLNLAAYAFNNCLIKNEDKREQITSSFLSLISVLSLIVVIVFILFIEKWEKIFGLDGAYIIAFVADGFMMVAIELWSARKKFDYEYKSVVFVTIIVSVINCLFGVVCVYFANDKALAAILVKIIAQAIVVFFLAVSVWGKGRVFFDKELWKYALCFNIPLIPHFLSTRILQQVDRIMINDFCGLSQAGIYGFSYKISEVMMIFNNAFLASIIPWTYRKLKEKKYREIQNKIILTVIIIGAINLVLILLAPEVVLVLGTKEYLSAIYVIPPIACSTYLMYVFNIFVNVTYYYEKNNLVVIASVCASVLNIILNYIFIPRYGYVAAGYTTLASYIVLVLMHYIIQNIAKNTEGVREQIYSGKKFMFISFLIIVIGCSSVLLYNRFIIRYIMVILIGLIILRNRKKILQLLK